MTIHHDKTAYGKLASSREEVSEERLSEMLKKLAEEEEEGEIKPSDKEKTAPDKGGRKR